MEVYVGDKFYYKHSKNDSLNLRVARIKNENTFNCKRNDGNIVKITKQELKDNYIRIIPHGSIFVSIVDMGEGVHDIIVSLFRMRDFKEKSNIEPWCICRQQLSDVFSEAINTNPHLKYCGLSISQETMPVGNQFKDVLACNAIVENKKYDIYLDDKLEDILYLIDKRYSDKVNNTLEDLYKKMNDDFHTGYTKSLNDLLVKNDFTYDFLKAFDIERVSFAVIEPDGTQLLPEHRYEVERLTSCEMLKTYVIPFNYNINLNEIKRSYQMICDIHDNVYIIAYDKGKYMTESLKESIKRNNDVYLALKGLAENNKK